MKKTYLHIGPHKTGSTYIQKTFYKYRHELLEMGVTYPEGLIGPQWGHHKLVEAIKQKKTNEIVEFVQSLGEINIVSSENLEYLDSADIDALLRAIGDHEVHVIYFKRRYSDLLVSAWQEYVKHGGTKTWSSFILDELLRPYSGKILNGLQVLERWTEKQMIKSVHVVGYDALLDNNENIAQKFLQIVTDGDNVGNVLENEIINASMDLKQIEIIRIINSLAALRGLTVNHNIRDAFLELGKQRPGLIVGAMDSTAFLMAELSFDDCWGINILENQFYERFKYTRPRNRNRKFTQMPTIEVGVEGCLDRELMQLANDVINLIY